MVSSKLETLVLHPVEEWYGSVLDIPIQLINPDPENLRKEFDEADLLDLGRNIERVGQLDEITVFPICKPDGSWAGFFDLHDGERRWRAAQLLQMPALRAKVVSRPSDRELLFKKVSRVMQTRSLAPETKLLGLEKALGDLGILSNSDQWESFRDKLGGGPEWPQLVRVLRLDPQVRKMFADGLINFTIAQAVGRITLARQAQVAEYVVVNKINGRFFSTEMIPYLIEHPDSSPAQAFEHTRVGGWRQFTRSPYLKGEVPPRQEQVNKFLDACVAWERAWETVVVSGLLPAIDSDPATNQRLKDAALRLIERATAMIKRLESPPDGKRSTSALPPAAAST